MPKQVSPTWRAITRNHDMTKQPEALRVAEVLAGSPNYSGTPIWEAVDLLRRQHEAIVKLRQAIRIVIDYSAPPTLAAVEDWVRLRQALKDTEGL